ncbi:hypothetical protein TNCV_599941 [Trichonephila clavipes]|nr:hypothetical protein TNCV_599941 [Trichonephila clavipes]
MSVTLVLLYNATLSKWLLYNDWVFIIYLSFSNECGSLAVKVKGSWLVSHFKSSTTEDPTCTRGSCALHFSRLKRPPCWCGVVVKRGVPVSSSSLHCGSKSRGPSPKPLGELNSGTLLFTHSITPLKTHLVEGLMQVDSVEAQSPLFLVW